MSFFSQVAQLFSPGSDGGPSFRLKTGRLTEFKKIVGVLQQLNDEHQLLQVRLSDEQGTDTFTSAIIKVNVEKKLFYLDELTPESGHQRLMGASQCRISSSHNGITIDFKAELSGAGKLKDIYFYGMHIPEDMRYQQRRSFFRAHIPLSKTYPVTINVPGFKTINGVLRDISMGGVSIEFPSAPATLFSAGQIIDTVSVTLPGNKRLSLTITVKFYGRATRGARMMRLGGQFNKLPADIRKDINKLVIKMDRMTSKLRAS